MVSFSEANVGTAHYVAPEIIEKKQFAKPGDIWSCGVILHLLLAGSVPFAGSGERLQRNICRGRLKVFLYFSYERKGSSSIT